MIIFYRAPALRRRPQRSPRDDHRNAARAAAGSSAISGSPVCMAGEAGTCTGRYDDVGETRDLCLAALVALVEHAMERTQVVH